MMDGMAPTRALTTTSSGQRSGSVPGGAQSTCPFQDRPPQQKNELPGCRGLCRWVCRSHTRGRGQLHGWKPWWGVRGVHTGVWCGFRTSAFPSWPCPDSVIFKT